MTDRVTSLVMMFASCLQSISVPTFSMLSYTYQVTQVTELIISEHVNS